MTNAEIQEEIQKLNDAIVALEADPAYVDAKARMQTVYANAPGGQPWNSNGEYCWIDSAGTYWCDSNSNQIFTNARNLIASVDGQVASKKQSITSLQQQLLSTPETQQGNIAALQTAKTETNKWIFFGLLVLAIAALAIFLLFKTKIKKWVIITTALGVVIVSYFIFFGKK